MTTPSPNQDITRDSPLDARAHPAVAEHPYPLLFATISGAHLYGFPSTDSDYDIRGAHVLPAREVVGLDAGPDTVETMREDAGLEIDLVTHDIAKFVRLMLKRNGYVLEQLVSPLIVRTSPEHEELKALVPRCLSCFHAHHYLGFARTQWELFLKDDPPRAKPLLYVYRVLLTGIHLMRTGKVEANLPRLNKAFRLPYIGELIERKQDGGERGVLDRTDMVLYEAEYERLVAELEAARNSTHLPERATCRQELHDLLVRVRLATIEPTT